VDFNIPTKFEENLSRTVNARCVNSQFYAFDLDHDFEDFIQGYHSFGFEIGYGP
jgi:hypothetical protein